MSGSTKPGRASRAGEISDLPEIQGLPSDRESAARRRNEDTLIKIRDRDELQHGGNSGNSGNSGNPATAKPETSFGADILARKFNSSKKHLGARMNSFTHWRERIFFKEALLYFVFLSVFVVISLTARPSGYGFWLTETVRDQFTDEEFTAESAPNLKKTFLDVGSDGEFWDWLEGPLLGNLYPTEDYRGESLDAEDSRLVVGSLRRIGAVRLRQLRVKRGADCDVPPKFGDLISDCAGGFSRGNEDESPFGPAEDPERYKWSSRSDLNGVFTWGFVETYSGSGYVVNLPDTADGATQVVATLKKDAWVDKYTRAVFLEFTLYNPSVNLFVVSSMLVEFPVSGGAFPNPTFRTVRLFRYQLVSDYIRLVFELIFVLFVFYYIVEEIIELRDQGWAYFKTGWSFLDILNLCLFLAVIAIRIAQVYKESRLPIEDLQNPGGQDTFISFQDVAWVAQQEVNVNSVNAFLSWFKIFKYVKMSKRLSQLSRTMAKASVDIVNFLLMFMVVFLGYAHMGYMLFGTDIHGFRNYGVSLISLFRGVMGDFDFDAANASNRFLGPLFYITFMVLVFMVLLNMFLAIINAAYTIVTQEDEERESLLNFAGFFRESRDKIAAKLPWSKAKAADLSKKIEDAELKGGADADRDGQVDARELRGVLSQEEDVEDIMRRYDLDRDGQLSVNEYNRLREELKSRGDGPDGDDFEGEGDDGTLGGQRTTEGGPGGKGGKNGAPPKPPRVFRPRFGASQAGAMTYAKVELIEDQILKLERAVSALAGVVGKSAAQIDAIYRGMDSAVPPPPPGEDRTV